MKSHHIVFFETEPWMRAHYTQALYPHTCSFVRQPLSEKNVHKAAKATIIVIFIYSKITPNLLKKMPHLELITTTSTGHNHIHPQVKKHITVCNVPCYGKNSVAEFTFMLMLALSKKLLVSEQQLQKHTISHKKIMGLDLYGKTIGIIGTGNIGMHAVKIAYGFGMRLYAYDRCKNQSLIDTYNVHYTSLTTLLKKSDFISLHMPLTEKTKHLINKETLSYMQPHACIINTSRGELIATKDLHHALLTKQIAGAALDVLEEECMFDTRSATLHKKYPRLCQKRLLTLQKKLLKLPQVLITPHNAYNTQEALLRIVKTTIENITAFVQSKPINKVDL